MARFMQMTVKGLDTLKEKIETFINNVTGSTDRGLEANAKFVRDEAKKRAPVDTGYLEDHIVYNKLAKNSYEVRSSAINKSFDYAVWLHENPNWNLGPLSQRKQAGQSVRVGYKWLTRAVDENKNQLRKDFAANVKLELGKA